MFRVLASLWLSVSLVTGCASQLDSPSPRPESAASPGRSPDGAPSPTPPITPPGITFAPAATPPAAQLASIPIRGSADQIGNRVLMAPGPNGGLYVSIPRPPD